MQENDLVGDENENSKRFGNCVLVIRKPGLMACKGWMRDSEELLVLVLCGVSEKDKVSQVEFHVQQVVCVDFYLGRKLVVRSSG